MYIYVLTSKFGAIHVRTSPLACTAVRCSRPKQHPCPRLVPAVPRRGGGTRLREPTPAYVPAATAPGPSIYYIPACSWHAHIHAHHEGPAPGLPCFCYAQHPAPSTMQHPFPRARCPWARGRSQTQRLALRPPALAHAWSLILAAGKSAQIEGNR